MTPIQFYLSVLHILFRTFSAQALTSSAPCGKNGHWPGEMIINTLFLVLCSGFGPTVRVAPGQRLPIVSDSPHFTSDSGGGEYFYRYRVHLEDEPDDYEVTRVVRTRPESLAPKFEMEERKVSLHDLPGNQAPVDAVKDVASSEGVAWSARPVFFRSLKQAWQRSAEQIDPKPMTIDPNEGIQSGGWTVRRYGYDIWYADIHVQLYKKTPTGGEVPVGGEQIIDTYEYWIPVPLIEERFYPDVSQANESYHLPEGFGGIKFSDMHASVLGIGGATLPRFDASLNYLGNKGLTTSATAYRNDVLRTLPKRLNDFSSIVGLSPKKIDDMLGAIAGQGTSMNSLSVPGDPSYEGSGCESELSMPPGTLWLPDRQGYQSTMSTTPMRVSFPMFTSLGGGRLEVANGRMHCLNMALKEPAAGVRYFPYLNSDTVLDGLAELTSASRMRGPWDQVRTWIYTDKIGLEDANKRISPPVTKAQYLNGLYDVYRLGGLKPTDFHDAKIFTPALLSSPYSNDQAFGWFCLALCEADGKAVRKWLETSPEDIQNQITAPGDEYQSKHVLRLFNSLLASLNGEARVGALAYLVKAKGAEAVLKGKLGDFSMHLFSSDAKEAELALLVSQRYQ